MRLGQSSPGGYGLEPRISPYRGKKHRRWDPMLKAEAVRRLRDGESSLDIAIDLNIRGDDGGPRPEYVSNWSRDMQLGGTQAPGYPVCPRHGKLSTPTSRCTSIPLDVYRCGCGFVA